MTYFSTPMTLGRPLLQAISASVLLIAVHAMASTDLATAPLQTSTATQVKPNIFFVLDDSGSMKWDFMPDWVNQGQGDDAANPPELIRNSGYNGIYYDPAITYTPPKKYDGSSYASYTSGWTRVPYDGFGVQTAANQFSDRNSALQRNLFTRTDAGTTQDLTGTTYAAQHYTFVAGEYCKSANLKECNTQTASSTEYPIAAKLRWCSDDTMTDCQASRIETDPGDGKTYTIARYPGMPIAAASATAQLTVSQASSSRSVSSIKVNGLEILSSSASGSSNNNLAASIVTMINRCTASIPLFSSCTVAGYSATRSGAVVTITAPSSLGNLTATPAVTKTSSLTVDATAFSGGRATSNVPGRNILTSIVSGSTYPYPGTTSKASSRSDCAGNVCTYNEEMTNYANWWAYYRTRMQMTKTATSNAFATLDDSFRLGYMTINNNNGNNSNTGSKNTDDANSDFLNVNTFNAEAGQQKSKWYAKLTSATPNNGTSLRVSLSIAGQLYAGKLNGVKQLWTSASSGKKSGVTVTDPMQYACQRNYTMLSTDGYWNGSGGTQVDGSTSIGDEDGSAARPYKDGNNRSNTLADVAAYYYNTDLRTAALENATGSGGTDVASNNVPDGQQRMFTSTVGLGASGYMRYQSNYASATSGDYYDILKGTQTSAETRAKGICSWQNSGQCNWPTPASDSQTTIDDLWHAAVNGRGTYYSASNPAALKTGLSNFLQSVSAATGNAAAATTSNPNTVQGDNFLFQSTFRSVDWYGELARYRLDLDTGAQIPDADWSQSGTVYSNAANRTLATPSLDNRDFSRRSIYTYDGSARASFDWASMGATMRNLFNLSAISSLSQMCDAGDTCLDAAAKANSTTAGTTTGAAGINLVNFLRGDRSNEGPDKNTYYRQRAHVLGDIVDSQAVYIKRPMYNYADTGYTTFKSDQASRQGMVYVGANDGMLHAFNADNGSESWAYIPSMLLPRLYKLADKNYSNNHQYYVNATPQQGDVYYDGTWKTILVGGLGRGGRGFYALNVTDPTSPAVLWEFTADTAAGNGYTRDADLGYSFGTPVITKLSDGTWVVLVTSGYNNNEATNATGGGFVWVLNAKTGAIIKKISTGEGSRANPSGLARILAYSETATTNNKATTVYGGDLLGNVWRMDISALTASGGDAPVTKLATLTYSSTAQAITARPQVSKVGDARVVFVGTGRYLGVSDIANTDVQSIYAIKDSNTAYGNPRESTCSGTSKVNCFVKQTYTDSNNRRTASSTVSYDVDFDTMRGWYVDLPVSGERANTDPALQLGTLVFTTNVPSDDSACSPGGTSNIIYVNYRTGLAVPGSNDIGGLLSSNGISALASAATLVRLPNGKVVAIVNLSNGTTVTIEIPVAATNQKTRRVSWRELITGQ